jgi:hypothetical protein
VEEIEVVGDAEGAQSTVEIDRTFFVGFTVIMLYNEEAPEKKAP